MTLDHDNQRPEDESYKDWTPLHGLDEDLFAIWVDCHPRTQQELRREIVTGERDPATLTPVVILRHDNIVKERMRGVAQLLERDERRGREEAERNAAEAEKEREKARQDLTDLDSDIEKRVNKRIFEVKQNGGEESGRSRREDADWCKEQVCRVADEIESDKPELIGTDRPLASEVINSKVCCRH